MRRLRGDGFEAPKLELGCAAGMELATCQAHVFADRDHRRPALDARGRRQGEALAQGEAEQVDHVAAVHAHQGNCARG